MKDRDPMIELIQQAAGIPDEAQLRASRQQVKGWFEATAPMLVWDSFESPIGPMYLAATGRGISQVVFRVSQQEFLSRLDPLARIRRDPAALAGAVDEMLAYFEDPAAGFDLPLDLTDVTPFQRQALQLIRGIPTGRVWTYKDVAEKLGKPRASRAVGQAMARNPVPIVIPCHRVVGSGGALTGYGGGGGIATKRWLLEFEGAL